VFWFYYIGWTVKIQGLHWTRKLSYRKDDRAMRPIYECPEKFWRVLTTPKATFPEIRNGLLFRSILRMCVQNLKFVALPVPGIIGGTEKNFGSPWICPCSFFPKLLMGFCWMDPVNVPAKFEFHSFTRSWDNREYSKNLGSPWIRQRSLFSKFLMGFCSHGPCEYTCEIWTS